MQKKVKKSSYGNRAYGFCWQNGNNKVSLFLYVYIKIFRTMTKSVTEDDRGGVCLCIGGEWKAGIKQRENKWVCWCLSLLDKEFFILFLSVPPFPNLVAFLDCLASFGFLPYVSLVYQIFVWILSAMLLKFQSPEKLVQ